MHCSRRLIVQTLVFSLSYLHCQVSPPEALVVKGGTTWARNGRWILPEDARLPRNIQGSFTCRKSTTWDRQLYFPSEGRRAEDFFVLKNPTASAGFEPAKLWYHRSRLSSVDTAISFETSTRRRLVIKVKLSRTSWVWCRFWPFRVRYSFLDRHVEIWRHCYWKKTVFLHFPKSCRLQFLITH